MTIYYGFDPGTYQPWALNLQMDALGQPGVARGMQVQPLASPAMQVQLSLDAVQGDGVCYLPNGGWARIDATVTLGVPNNASGALRTDAVVAYVDPTGVSASTISYLPNWGTTFKGTANQLVLALVQVPNNATSIVGSNIVNTPLVASAGSAPQNYPDALVGSEQRNNQGCPPGLFEAMEVLVTTSAANGQTQFTLPLTPLQLLCPQGRIGGALETGFFAGPNGWYWPKVRGSVSGLLPVATVDPVGGTITTATAAQTGEAVTISYRYYDFGRDGRVRSGYLFVEKTSPYLVYQGEVVEDHQFGPAAPLWDGSQGAYLLLNPGESVWYCDYFSRAGGYILGGPGAQTNTINLNIEGVALGTTIPWGAANYPGATTRTVKLTASNPNGTGPAAAQFILQAGMLGFCGAYSVATHNTAVFVSGGLAQVSGQPVLVQSTSFALPQPTNGFEDSYVIYTDRYGNVSSSGGALGAPMDRILGRVPLAAAVQYGSPLGPGTASSSFGQWALPGSYHGWPVTVAVTGNNTASPGMGFGNGWSLQPDPLSPSGAVLVSSSQWDMFYASAVCTGMDMLVHTGGQTSAFQVWVDNPNPQTAYTSLVAVGGTTQHNVRVTLFSGLPYGSHTVKFNNLTTAASLWLEALDVRVPATPAAPPGTLPLAQVDVFGFSSLIRPSLLRGANVEAGTNLSTLLLLDAFRPQAEPSIWYSNTSSTTYPLVLPTDGTGGFLIHYEAGPDKGILTWSANNTAGQIDCYAAKHTLDVTAAVPFGGNVTQVNLSTSNQKNASSSGTAVVINAVDLYPWQTHVTDLRRFGVGHGHASELRGSSLQTALGGRLDDGGHGVRTEQLRDRGVTSRKMAPTWQTAVAATNYSGFPGIDPSLSLSVTVEVPSLLVISYYGSPVVMPTSGCQVSVLVDGVAQGAPSMMQNETATAAWMNTAQTQLVPVPAGTHLIQTSYNDSGFGKQPYLNGTGAGRGLSVLAFAL